MIDGNLEKRGGQPNQCEAADGALEHLRNAEQDLERAREKEREAERDIARAEEEVKEAIEEIKHPHVFSVEVVYDGVKKKFEVRNEETVKQLLDQAIRAFGPLPNPHTLSLYKDGKEWKPVEKPSGYPVAANSFCEVTFKEVTTSALRVEVQLEKDYSGGILEWRVK